MSDYPKLVWDKNIFEQSNLVRTNMTKEDLAKFKNQFTPLIIDNSPTLDMRKYMMISYLSRKYNIKPSLNPVREHWLIRLVNDCIDGKISSVEEFIEREKDKNDETEI